MKEPLITTIILTYRRPDLLKKAIQSVLSQTYPHFQVWICDNASQDETAEIVREFVEKDPRVKYVCHEKNLGMMGNYQFGLTLVNTEFFSFLSDDDVLLPNFYETVLQEFDKYPEAGFAAGSTIIMSEKGETARIPLSYWSREGKFDPPEGVLEMIGKYPVPTSILFRKKVLECARIDGENPFLWDCDYLLQIASMFPIVISKKICAIFRQHDSSYSNQQNIACYEEAFGKLVSTIQKKTKLTDEKSRLATNLILFDLAQYHKHYFLFFLKQKQFDEACKITQLIGRHPSFKKKAVFYLYIAKVCKFFPLVSHGLSLLRHTRQLIKKWRNRKNEHYASNL